MAEVKFNTKNPIGMILVVIAAFVFIYVEFLMPFHVTSRDKRAIKQKIEELKCSKMGQIATGTAEKIKATGNVTDGLKKMKELTGEIKITDVKGKKSFFSGTKIKVVYTIGGKTPKADGGVLYFKLYRQKNGRTSNRRRVSLFQISKKAFEGTR